MSAAPIIDRTDVASRSHGELGMYMREHPCPACGATETHTLARAEHGAETHYVGPCPACGLVREFRFRTPPAVLAPKTGGLAPGDAPSQLFDRAQLLAIAERSLADADLPDDATDLHDLTRVTSRLSVATTALVEAAKFPGPSLAERISLVRERRDRVDARRREADRASGHVPVDRAVLRAHWSWSARGGVGPGRLVTRGAVLSGRALRGIDLAGAQLTEATLDRANLSYGSLARIELTSCSAVRTSFMNADLADARILGCVLRGADLRLAVLRDARVEGGDWQRVAADRGGWHGARLVGVDLRDSALDDVVLDRAELVDCDLSGSRMARVAPPEYTLVGTAYDTRFVGCDLRGASVGGRVFGHVELERCRLAGISGQPVLKGPVRIIDCEGEGGRRLDGGAEVLGWSTP